MVLSMLRRRRTRATNDIQSNGGGSHAHVNGGYGGGEADGAIAGNGNVPTSEYGEWESRARRESGGEQAEERHGNEKGAGIDERKQSHARRTYGNGSFSERVLSSTQAGSRSSSDADVKQRLLLESGDGGSVFGSIRPETLPFVAVFKLLLLPRVLSSVLNIIHDCDETFNYWEPLHYLLNGSGFQTWEYSAEYGLRTWSYIALHAAPAMLILKPLQSIFPGIMSSLAVFYLVRASLAACSAAADALLVVTVSRMTERRVAIFCLVFVMSASALFTQSTAFLPSSFSMMMITMAVVSVLNRSTTGIVAWSGVSCLIGWPFTALACAPFGISALIDSSFADVLLRCLVALLVIAAPMMAIDRAMYGRWIFTQFNLLHYNVFGGGDSTLYGVESWSFYLRNLLNGFNAVFPVALVSIPFVWLVARDIGDRVRLLVVLAPLYCWLSFLNVASEHKEERFMAPIYTIICLGGAVAAAGMCRAGELSMEAVRMGKRGVALCRMACWACVMLTVLISTSRTAALVTNYSAPMHIYGHLPTTTSPKTVCLGSEWHRFPSSFHLPPHYEAAFVKIDSNQSMLPVRFDNSIGGSASAPPALNDRNEPHDDTYVRESTCDYMIQLLDDSKSVSKRYEVVASLPYVDTENSPALTRAFFIPSLSRSWNVYAEYVLLRQKRWL